MTAYPQLAKGAATLRHLHHGDGHAIPGLGGPGKGIVNVRRKRRGRRIMCSVVAWTDGIKYSHLATFTSLSHRPITFSSVVFLLQLKKWFSSCGATSHLGQRLSTWLQLLLK